ncbi:Transmembrane_domain-containing protein [Hexamita inflata]|uniref:Transmembrane domain-containing protein n=1 Tax=Hexamita inflata TaxID=28002 RepID=A0AA86QAH5_9EUKA|nr:Transmembrane domain-containing protein [Hexamita inflata]
MSFSTQTKEQSYEMSLTSTLVFNIVFTVIVFLIFPIVRRYLPAVFAPQQHLKYKHTRSWGTWFWFFDVFQQPLAVYSTRGNLATIFAVFQMLLLSLYAFIAFISLTILIPVYWYGTDQNWNANYLTYWSKITLPHLEQGSIMILVPYIVVIVITVATMFFYHQFTLLYVYFRQRCLKRVTAQNFMVLLQNIPSILNEREKTYKVIDPMMSGVKTIIPVPQQCNKLTKLSEELDSLKLQLEKMKRYVSTSTLKEQQIKTQVYRKYSYENITLFNYYSQQSNRHKNDQQQKQLELENIKQFAKIKESRKVVRKHLKGLDKLLTQIRLKTIEVRNIMQQDHIEEEYLDKIQLFPPQMPDIILQSFNLLPNKQQIQPKIRYDDENQFIKACIQTFSQQDKFNFNIMQNQQYINISKTILQQERKIFQKVKQLMNIQLRQSNYKNQPDQRYIGSSVFLFCDSQSIASEKYTALIASDSKQPEALLAPNPHEIVWKYMAISNTQKFIRKIIFVLVLAGLFVGYIWGQTKILGIINNSSNAWQIFIFKGVCPNKCTFGTIQTGYCVVCDGFSKMFVTMIPTLFNCILMAFLPLFINWAVKLLCYPSISKNIDLEYQLLFVFLIIIVGIIQVSLPDMIDVKSGQFSLAGLKDLGIQSLIDNLGHNVASQQFTFINYIVNKYCAVPVFSLLNISGIINWILAHGQKNSLDFNLKLRFSKFNFNKQLAYTAHMFVVGFIFAIVAPITNVIIFVTYLLLVIIDRYFILYVNTPTVTSDLSSQANMLVNVIGTISIGLIFMLISTGCYFFIQSGPLANLGAAVCVICLILSIIFKLSVDKRYNRALSTLTKGNYEATGQLYINPVNKKQWYHNEKFPKTEYDIKKDEDRILLNDLVKYKETYNQNIFDNLLGKIHVDLTILPVSQVILDDSKIGEVRCSQLNFAIEKEDRQDNINEKQNQKSKKYIIEYPQLENQQLSKSEQRIVYDTVDDNNVVTGQFTEQDVNFMASYTHPAILQQVDRNLPIYM